MIEVLLVEDHPMFRLGLVTRLGLEDDITVVGEAGSVAEALEQVELTAPDVVLVDLNLPDGSGLDLIPQIVAASPRTACLVLTMRDDASAYAAIRAGAKGYLLKDASPGSVLGAIRTVAGGDVVLGVEVAARLLAAVDRPQ